MKNSLEILGINKIPKEEKKPETVEVKKVEAPKVEVETPKSEEVFETPKCEEDVVIIEEGKPIEELTFE